MKERAVKQEGERLHVKREEKLRVNPERFVRMARSLDKEGLFKRDGMIGDTNERNGEKAGD